MKSIVVTFRLNYEEFSMLTKLTTRGGALGETPSEFFRGLLWREAIRRNLSERSTPPQSIYSEMRNGRPKTV